MIYVLGIFALGLSIAAWRVPRARLLLALFAALNLGCAWQMVRDDYAYAWRLRPHVTAPGIEAP